MTSSQMMRSAKSLIIVVLLAIFIQNIECKNVGGEIKPADNILLVNPYALATRERDLRGLRDVWDQVKNSAISSWNFVKRVADNTRDNILKLADSARQYALQVEKSFKEQLQVLQNRLNDIIKDLLGTSKLVQECLESEGGHIKDALRELLKHMSECVSNQIEQLTQISGKHSKLNVNDTLFITDLDNKLDACETDQANYEECLYSVRELVYDDMEELDFHFQETSLESRSLADDIRNTMALCLLQNLADASSYLTSEIMEVVKCVLDSKGINESIIE